MTIEENKEQEMKKILKEKYLRNPPDYDTEEIRKWHEYCESLKRKKEIGRQYFAIPEEIAKKITFDYMKENKTRIVPSDELVVKIYNARYKK